MTKKSGAVLVFFLVYNFGSYCIFAQADSLSPLDLVSEKKLEGASLSGYVSFSHNSEGALFILDSELMTVFKYNHNLVQVAEFGGKGTGEGKFEIASDIHIDDQNQVFISDPYLKRISVFNEEGKFLRSFEVRNQVVDMISYNDMLCTHTGGAKPIDDVVIHCYEKATGKWKKALYNPTENIGHIPWGFSNVTFQTIHFFNEYIFSLSHPFEGFVHVFDKKGNQLQEFQIANERFENPQFPSNYNVLKDIPFYFTDSLYIHGIHILPETIVVIFVEHGSGIKYLDLYDLEGNRKISHLIFLGYQFPVYNDEDGYLYALRHAKKEGEFYLKKYRLYK